MDGFHDVRFPLPVALGATGGPVRRTEIVTLGSGREERNQRWKHSKRRYDAGTGVKTRDDLFTLVDFFEERRGRLYGFRFHDPLDHKTCSPSQSVAATDQELGVGDGAQVSFPLIKTYGGAHLPYARPIRLPVTGSVVVAVDGVPAGEGAQFDVTDGAVVFRSGHVPGNGATVTAGFWFDTPVRFDLDELNVNLSDFEAGSVPTVPIVEIVL